MKMVKSLLLGTAAGMIAVAGAQAADMPVKAKPVEYVKICTLYGAGFYYIPGTDTCIKIGGYLRVQVDNAGGGSGGIVNGSGFQQMTGQGRYHPRPDQRHQLSGPRRGLVRRPQPDRIRHAAVLHPRRLGEHHPGVVTGGGTTPSAFWERAFIQFAGFTVGRAQSFFDMFTYGGAYSYLNVRTSGDTGASGQNLWAYTVQFGNGVSYYAVASKIRLPARAPPLTTHLQANFIGDQRLRDVRQRLGHPAGANCTARQPVRLPGS